MALFRDHITVGALVAAVGVVLLYFYAIVTDPLLLIILFVVSVIGSFLPDLDHDTGTPFYIIFGVFTLACGGVVLYYLLSHPPQSLYMLIGVPVVTLFGVWFVVGAIFKNFTDHRGMMHSLPTAAIVSLIVFLVAEHLEQGETLSAVFALAVGAGFVSHLALDEIHSQNMLGGNPFIPRRSLGTAFKFFSNSMVTNIFTYTLLATLAYSAVSDFWFLGEL